MDRGGGFTIEQGGPNGWTVIMYSGLVGLALVVLAMALFALANWIGAALASLAQYVGVGTLMLSGGQFVFMTCRGAALIVDARGRAKALEAEAQTRRIATMRGKPLPPTPWRVVRGDDEFN